MKNKILSSIIAVLTAASLVSCSSSGKSSKTSSTETASTEVITSSEETETSEAASTEGTSGEQTTAEVTTEEKTTESGASVPSDSKCISDYANLDTPCPAIWKATDPSTGNFIYLMGTIHVIPEEAKGVPDYVMDCYDASEGIAVEIDADALKNDQQKMAQIMVKTMYSDGTTIKDHISEETYNTAVNALKQEKQYSVMYDYFCPGMWINELTNLSIAGIEKLSSDGIDMFFLKRAKADKKEVAEIESLDIQINAMVAYTDKLADYLLKESSETYSDYANSAQSLAELYNLWAEGKIDEMLATEDEEAAELPDDLKADYTAYNQIMIFDRNKGMAEKAAEYIKNGKKYFFMVGSMHFAGDKGVDDLLQNMGYTVERIH